MADDCACVYFGGEDCGPRVSYDRIQRARKSYQCCECGNPIVAGDPYEYTWGVWGEKQDTFRICLGCVDVRDSVSCDGSFIYGQLWNNVQEAIFYNGGPQQCTYAGLNPHGDRKMREQYAAWKEDHA